MIRHTGPLLEVRDLVRHFGGLKAVDGVSFTVERGEVLGLVGPNGSGKSTVLGLISGRIAPMGGEVRLGGRPITGYTPENECRAGIAGIIAILAIGLLGLRYQVGDPWIALAADWRTTPGEMRQVTLNDGTIVDLGPEEGKNQFGQKEWKTLVTKVRDGTVWEEIVQAGYQGREGSVDADVVSNL